MAKDYVKGESYSLYRRQSGTWGAAVWGRVAAIGDLAVDIAPGDVEVPERGFGTGHLQGDGDPSFTFTLFNDAGNADVTALVAAMNSGDAVGLAVARTEGEPYWAMECVLVGSPFNAGRGEPAGWEVEAKRDANSDADLIYGSSFDLDETD